MPRARTGPITRTSSAATCSPCSTPWSSPRPWRCSCSAIGAARSNQLDLAQKAIDRLTAIQQTLVAQKDAYWADQVEIQRLGAAAWLARAMHDDEKALSLMRSAANLEASTDKHPVTPGAIVPARELLSEMLLNLGNAQESLAEAQHALRDAPNRRNGLWLASQATKSVALLTKR